MFSTSWPVLGREEGDVIFWHPFLMCFVGLLIPTLPNTSSFPMKCTISCSEQCIDMKTLFSQNPYTPGVYQIFSYCCLKFIICFYYDLMISISVLTALFLINSNFIHNWQDFAKSDILPQELASCGPVARMCFFFMKSLPLSKNRSWKAGLYEVIFKVKIFLSKVSNLCKSQQEQEKNL